MATFQQAVKTAANASADTADDNILDANNAIKLENASMIAVVGQVSGDTYVNELEAIQQDIDKSGGTTLGTMVGAQLQMTEAETSYMVRSGLPKKAMSTRLQAGQEIKKASG